MYLTNTSPYVSHCVNAKRQRGIVMMIAMIMLVALSLTAIALIRSVYTTNIIAGNIAFQESARNAAEAGIEDAIAWLQANNIGAKLHNNVTGSTDPSGMIATNGFSYLASRQDPNRSSGQTWDDYWNQVLAPSGNVNTLPTDTSTGNTVSFVIHRLCQSTGDPASGSGCAYAPATDTTDSNSRGVGIPPIKGSGAIYYRITVRVAGPRNTASYVQAIVSMS